MPERAHVQVPQHAEHQGAIHRLALRWRRLSDLIALMPIAYRLIPARRIGGQILELDLPAQIIGQRDEMPRPVAVGEILRTLIRQAAQGLGECRILQLLAHRR